MSSVRRVAALGVLAAGALLAVPTVPAQATPAVPVHAAAAASAQVAPAGAAPSLVAGASALGSPAQAAAPAAPRPPTPPAAPRDPAGVSVNIDGTNNRNQVVTIIVLMTVLSVAPSVLLMMTSFTKIAIVLALVRQAIGTPTIPPNQVIAGVAMFLSLFVMGPVLGQVNDVALKPFMDGSISVTQAVERGQKPLATFMLKQTGDEELTTMIQVSGQKRPARPEDVEFTTLIPAFVLSELKTAFIIGFVIFVPFLVIDLVVASILMSMGMMMLPPVMISLPFKILLFIMVDGWSLITKALVASYLGT